MQDIPVSFSPEHRQYTSREVVLDKPVQVDNPQGWKPPWKKKTKGHESSDAFSENKIMKVVKDA